MRRILLLTTLLFIFFKYLSAGIWPHVEIYMFTTGLTEKYSVRYIMESQSVVYNAYSPYHSYYDNRDVAYYPYPSMTRTGNTDFDNPRSFYGFDHNNSLQPPIADNHGYALYKMTVYVYDSEQNLEYEGPHFFIDFRDCNYKYYADICIKFDFDYIDVDGTFQYVVGSFSYYNGGDGAQNPLEFDWIDIDCGATKTIWQIKSKQRCTSGWPEIPDEISISRGRKYPIVSWNTNNDTFTQEYEVFRAFDDGNSLSKFKLVGKKTHNPDLQRHSWQDNSVTTKCVPTGTFFYKVSAHSQYIESPLSNSVSTLGSPITIDRIAESPSLTQLEYDYHLYNNYPNPFNPSTTIAFDIKEDCKVDLMIYDILGNKILNMLNDFLQKGHYTVKFQANDLPAGIYLYKIKTGKYSEVKRMLLLK
jgi:hypothetical protein